MKKKKEILFSPFYLALLTVMFFMLGITLINFKNYLSLTKSMKTVNKENNSKFKTQKNNFTYNTSEKDNIKEDITLNYLPEEGSVIERVFDTEDDSILSNISDSNENINNTDDYYTYNNPDFIPLSSDLDSPNNSNDLYTNLSFLNNNDVLTTSNSWNASNYFPMSLNSILNDKVNNIKEGLEPTANFTIYEKIDVSNYSDSIIDYDSNITENNVDNFISFEISKGDTLWEISEGFTGSGLNWSDLLEYNNIDCLGNSNPLLIPGEKLIIPANFINNTI